MIVKSLLMQYQCMPFNEKEEFLSALESCLSGRNCFTPDSKIEVCPHCKSYSVRKNGFYKEKQKYKCKECNREFRATTNTCVYYSKRPERVKMYLLCLFEGLSVAKTAVKLKVREHIVFQWRHKILGALGTVNSDVISRDANLIISEFKYSTKGLEKRRVKKELTFSENMLVYGAFFLNEEGDVAINVTGLKKMRPLTLRFVLAPKLNASTVVKYIPENAVTRALKGALCRKEKVEAFPNSAFIGECGPDALKLWMTRFRGVASKYLQNYLNWFLFHRCYESPRQLLQKIITRKLTGYDVYSQYKKCRDLHAFKGI